MPREIAELLGEIALPGSFAVQRTAPAEAIRIEVAGIGPLQLPLSSRTAERLADVAKPARYGLRDRTLFDRKVRNSWEISRRRIRIDQRRWNETLIPLLDDIRAGLGLAEGVKLKAELHNMLLYQEGQFFRSHQDSEKSDAMIGTLAVILPSPFRGGVMVVEQHGETMRFRGSRTALQLVAFYADCRHEVRPVTSGARVVLTYNLLAKSPVRAMPPRIEPGMLDALTAALQRHFETPLPPRFGGEAAPPDRLVYLLDHEYTARGLRWDLLKGIDAARAVALRTAAERFDCEIFLAQADVHETWECEGGWEEDWRPYRSRSYRDSWDDFDDYDGEEGDADDDEPTPTDLIDSEIELRNWVASGSRKPAAISSVVGDEELCYTLPSADMNPFQSDYTGYMGNWGNTLDRWYHRGALVIWPRERTFVIRARASASWALQDVVKTLRRGKTEEARRKVETLLPFWSHTASSAAVPLLPNALRAAAGLGEAMLASRVLDRLPLETFDAEAASLLEPLLSRFGLPWSREMLSTLSVARGDAHLHWLTQFPRICEELCAAGEEGWALAGWLAAWQWEWLGKELHEAENEPSPSHADAEISALVPPVLAILQSAEAAGAADLQETIVHHLGAIRTERRVDFLTALLRESRKRDVHRQLALLPLYERCTESLTAWLSEPPRAPGDWSIVTDLRCRCERCRTLRGFLIAPEKKVFEWPLAKEHRAHVHQAIEGHELPVAHQTRRTGRPYSLVLTKREALFERDAARRKRWAEDLAWLRRAESGAR